MGLAIIEEMVKLLLSDPKTQSSTTLVVAPYFCPDDFFDFMTFVSFFIAEFLDNENDEGVDVQEDCEEGEEENKLETKLGESFQLVPFHPKFEFQESTPTAVDNYTNRSPYPTFHILREEEVDYAVKLLGGDSSKIWDRNVRLMKAFEERIGLENVKKIMSVDEEITDREVIKDVFDVLDKNPPFSWGRKKRRPRK